MRLTYRLHNLRTSEPFGPKQICMESEAHPEFFHIPANLPLPSQYYQWVALSDEQAEEVEAREYVQCPYCTVLNTVEVSGCRTCLGTGMIRRGTDIPRHQER